MFSKAESRAKWDSRISDILINEFGALQGCMLSPKLLTDFLQDIYPHYLTKIKVSLWTPTLLMVYLLFADDLAFFFRIC